jgi:hypothetical protein
MLPTLAPGADIYKYYDKDGNLVLSDEVPQENADKVQRIEARPVMTVPAAAPAKGRRAEATPAPAPAPAAAKKPEAVPGYVIRVQSPVAEQTYPKGGDAIPVAIAVSPGLRTGDRLETRLDGEVVANLTSIAADQLDRGEHRLAVRVLSAEGKPLASAVVPFYIQQRSALKPGAKAGK